MKLEIQKKGVIVMTEKTWYRVPIKLLKDNRLTASDIAVFAMIADEADGGKCTLSTAEIATNLNLCKLTVKRSVVKLAELSYIAVEHNPGKPSAYRQLILEPKRRHGRASEQKQQDISKYDFVIEQTRKEIERELKEAK